MTEHSSSPTGAEDLLAASQDEGAEGETAQGRVARSINARSGSTQVVFE